jgi:uncharacterized membrane protein
VAAPAARRPPPRVPRPPGLLVGSTRRRNRRLDWLLLRWQARLDASWADRVVPWVLAAAVFVVYAGVALARVDRLDTGAVLARYVQAAWHLAEGRPPELTIGADGNLFADRLPLLFVPLAALTRVLPITTTLLVVQAAVLASGIVPLWLLARKVVRLRVGAALALAFAYACHPAIADLTLGDFNPQAMALSPLLAAFYFAERRAWTRFALACIAAVLWSSDLGLVIAATGLVLVAEGERRIGVRAFVGGLAWTLVALLAVQSPLGRTGIVAPGAFANYGDGGFDVLVEMLRNPFRPIVDMLERREVATLVWVLAPLAFLPVLNARKLLPAVPLTALVLVADVPIRGPDGGGRMVPFIAVSFVAATFALARFGRPSVERIIVDRRLLALVGLASVGALLSVSPLSPYDRPWSVDRPGEAARREVLAAVPPVVAVRLPADLATEVADRRRVEIVAPGETDPAVLADGVDALIIDESTYPELDAAQRHALRRSIDTQGMVQVRRVDGMVVYVRILEHGLLVESRLPKDD